MDKMVKTKIAILNLTGGLSPELSAYFARKKILIVDPETDHSNHTWTHILTKDTNDFTNISSSYDTIEKDVKIISLTAVEDLQHFIVSNGKLIIDELWMKNSLGAFILDKFLQESGGIALEDNYPTFKEKGSFIITNPFNTGEYLDQMVQSAYLEGISGLSIKTFFDHLVMYLTGLKNKGKLGMPIEVMYGFFEDVFGVQLHFFTKDLILEDVSSSLSSNISKKAEKYLLNIAVQSSDFFDFTLLREVNKTVITGLWTKDDRIQSENRGLLFNDLTAAAGITSYPTEGITSFQVNAQPLSDLSEKIILPPTAEEEEVKTTVSGSKDEEEVINHVKGMAKEEEKVFKISGAKNFDVEKYAFRVSAGIEDKNKGENNLKIKSLQNELPEAIKSSFHSYVSKLNKTVEEISEEEFQDFNEVEIPLIIKKTSENVDAQAAPSTKAIEIAFEAKVNTLNSENEMLKSKMKTLMSEVKILKESKTQMAEIQAKAANAAAASSMNQNSAFHADNALKSQILERMNLQKGLSEDDAKKLAGVLEKEAKFLKDSKDQEIQLRKLQIEAVQKEAFFSAELEKLNRSLRAKELVVTKTKESFSKLVEQKIHEISNLNEKLNQMSKLMATNQAQNHGQQIRDLERQVLNHEKMIEIYKTKIIQKPIAKTEDDSSKDESRRLQIMNNQIKHQLEIAKKESAKFQERVASDTAAINVLKMDKIKLEQQLKKAAQDAKREVTANADNHQQDQEVKKLQLQHDFLDSQLKAKILLQKELELKLQEALKNQKKENVSEEASTKGKTAHLENNVRKLTQDLVESRNQLAEMKKETNKLRQDKTSLQNQFDKMKKDLDKAKGAVPQKPGTPGKAA
jgi:hypothetical protein